MLRQCIPRQAWATTCEPADTAAYRLLLSAAGVCHASPGTSKCSITTCQRKGSEHCNNVLLRQRKLRQNPLRLPVLVSVGLQMLASNSTGNSATKPMRFASATDTMCKREANLSLAPHARAQRALSASSGHTPAAVHTLPAPRSARVAHGCGLLSRLDELHGMGRVVGGCQRVALCPRAPTAPGVFLIR